MPKYINMKKITLILFTLVGSLTTFAQNYYNFTKSTIAYTDLTNAISINNGQAWSWPEYGPFISVFPIDIFGQTYTQFGFDGNFFMGEETNIDSHYVKFFPVSALIVDRNFNGLGTSLSPISYKVDGTIGNRILKFEIKNAGLELESDSGMSSTSFLNYQVWFYEADKSFEYRFGPTNITSLSLFNDSQLSASGFYYESDENYRLVYIGGSLSAPSYNETTNDEIEPVNLNAVIPANTVYRFSINTLSIQDQDKVEFSMFPNPVQDLLYLTFSETIKKQYSVYDILGREVINGKIENENEIQISTDNLKSGSYILKIGGTTKKFIKK